jgi:tRNA modification GTPase
MGIESPYDTIAAVSTPTGEGGIGIVRLSGARALDIVRVMFEPRMKGRDLFDTTFTMQLGYIRKGDTIIDEVLVSVMKAPATYTREDVVEINCHGGAVAVEEVLRLVLTGGARLAEPGEFTRRAFINGRIDLAQAEAVLDIVRAKTSKALEHAVRQLKGTISQKIEQIVESLKGLLLHLEAAIDFPEEDDVQPLDYRDADRTLQAARSELDSMLGSYDTGKMLKDGVLTVISGKPNVGKSSLLNAFLRYDRAIVTEIPGTTRDVIEEQLNLGGIPFILADTAGITDTHDRIEREGVRRSVDHMERAQLVVLMLDGSKPLDERDREIAVRVSPLPHITVVNKSDLTQRFDASRLEKLGEIDRDFIHLSARTGDGLKELEQRMVQKVVTGSVEGDRSLLITSARQFSVLSRARTELDHALRAVQDSSDPELIAYDVKSCLDALGEITGRISSRDIMNEIFENFCIGK